VNGLPEDYDSDENVKRLINEAGLRPLPETDRFCIESAGLSALTQMEWSIRRAIEEGTVKFDCDTSVNSEKIRRIWKGEEIFDDLADEPEIEEFLAIHSPRLFKCYEKVLNGFCRDKNLEIAKADPERFRVKGSFEWMQFLKDNGVKNYFVTGAVVEKGMGMHEEVETLGYRFGSDEMMEDIYGSTWTEKIPKNVVMQRLMEQMDLKPENVMVVGDGRSEIFAGVEMGALCVSRLPADAEAQRRIHTDLGTNMIVEDWTDPALYKNLFAE
jgi:phosphoglycolate phosphatase-like HAD superfamily hydrolase